MLLNIKSALGLAICAGLCGCHGSGDQACLLAAEQWRTRENADLNAKIMQARRRQDVLTYAGLPGKSNQACAAGGVCVERAARTDKEKEAFAQRERALARNDVEVAKMIGAGVDDGKAWRAALDDNMRGAEKSLADMESLDARYQAKVRACSAPQ